MGGRYPFLGQIRTLLYVQYVRCGYSAPLIRLIHKIHPNIHQNQKADNADCEWDVSNYAPGCSYFLLHIADLQEGVRAQ